MHETPSLTWRERLPLARVMKLPPFSMKLLTYESIRPAVVGPKEPEA